MSYHLIGHYLLDWNSVEKQTKGMQCRKKLHENLGSLAKQVEQQVKKLSFDSLIDLVKISKQKELKAKQSALSGM
jgi:hypothetical protein